MKDKTMRKNMEKKALESAELEYVSGGTDGTQIDDERNDPQEKPGVIRRPFTRYPPSHLQ